MNAYLHCLSHTPLVGFVDPAQEIKQEVFQTIDAAGQRIAEFDPEVIILFSPDHYNGFFYDVMPSFCIGTKAYAIGDFGTASGPLNVPEKLAEECAGFVLDQGVDVAISYTMQVDHGFAQPLEFLFGSLATVPVIPIFINSVAQPLPSFQRARVFGEAVGKFAQKLQKRVLFLASGGLSHQPPVPELETADALVADRMKGSGRHLPAEEREARTQRVITAARNFTVDQNVLHPLNPRWDQSFMYDLASGQIEKLDAMKNSDLSEIAGKSTHEVKTWVAAFAALSTYGSYQTTGHYYREIPEWIAGFGSISASPSDRASHENVRNKMY